jgi:hypothetical protein
MAALASGLAIVALGIVLLLSTESGFLEGGWLASAVAACTGVALLFSGLGSRDE